MTMKSHNNEDMPQKSDPSESHRSNSTWDKLHRPCRILPVLCMTSSLHLNYKHLPSEWFRTSREIRHHLALPIRCCFPPVRVDPLTLQIRLILSFHWLYWESRWLTSTITYIIIAAIIATFMEIKQSNIVFLARTDNIFPEQKTFSTRLSVLAW